MDTKNLQLAAYNNAAWCDTVCRSHDIPGTFHEAFWVNLHRTPPYYPNLVTLTPTLDLEAHQNALAALLTERRGYPISVKDSFATLDLTPCGFHQLFQAQWIFRPAPAKPARQETADIQWKQIMAEEELLHWEEAWSQTAVSRHRLFLPALLYNSDICIVAAYQEKQIIAGAIANRTPGVVGLSNVFTLERGMEPYGTGLLSLVATCYPGLPLVGYEQDESLAAALRVGFTTFGPLRVWMKEA
jgi:hypothetical protein